MLLLQLAILLAVARLGAEITRRLGFPGVVGELTAGVLLGPSVLGHLAPSAAHTLFPPESLHLLEAVGSLGMVFLLLTTGFETDLKRLRNLSRAALGTSLMGIVLPFASGFALGLLTPDRFLAEPDRRVLFSFFLATAMAISAMPVIARILMDLDLTRRNIGLVILSAGVVDDTAGWLILSVIAGAATHRHIEIGGVLRAPLLLMVFLAGTIFVVYPATRWVMSRVVRRARTQDADLACLVVLTLLFAATTDWIGVHAVLGAFVAGMLFRQVPEVRQETVQRLESFASSVLTPIFFGLVGLKVNLRALDSWSMVLAVLSVACLGKLVGCTLGSLWGGLRFWEGLSVAVAMNARGAMELVVATVGLSLGILNQQMFSIIVLMAIVTSFMASIGLRLTLPKVRMTDEETRRILAEQSRGLLDAERLRVLVPLAGGGPNSLGALAIASGLSGRSAYPVECMHVQAPIDLMERLARVVKRGEHRAAVDPFVEAGEHFPAGGRAPGLRRVHHRDVASAIVTEAGKGADIVVLGASRHGDPLDGPILQFVVDAAPCHLAIVRSGADGSREPFKRLVVPFDGSVFTRTAVEFAICYAEGTGAEVTVALFSDKVDLSQVDPYGTIADPSEVASRELLRISSIFRVTALRPKILRFATIRSLREAAHAARSAYDLVVIGAENLTVTNRLFFGHEDERLIEGDTVAAAIVVPNIGLLRKDTTVAAQKRLRSMRGEPVPDVELAGSALAE